MITPKCVRAGVVLLCVMPPAGAMANPACNAQISGTVVLTEDMNCQAVKAHGVRLNSNSTLDCAGHTIYGPDGEAASGTQPAATASMPARAATSRC